MIIKLIAFIFFGLPLLALLAWLFMFALFVAVLGRPDWCPLNSC